MQRREVAKRDPPGQSELLAKRLLQKIFQPLIGNELKLINTGLR